jgi:hypothetical protein
MSAWVDLSLMFLTFFCAIIWNIEIGIMLSLIASLLLVVHRSSKTRMTILVRFAFTIVLIGEQRLNQPALGENTRDGAVEAD